MQRSETSPGDSAPDRAWTLFDDQGEIEMRIKDTANELAALARAEERKNVLVYWILAVGIALLAAMFLHNVFTVAQPWVRVGSAWTLGVLCYGAGAALQRGPRRSRTNETCASFLEREYAEKRQLFLELRRGLMLLVPGIAASCWGGGPLERAKAAGFPLSSWQFQLSSGPWPFLTIGVVLTLVWTAFGRAADKALRDWQDLQGSIGA